MRSISLHTQTTESKGFFVYPFDTVPRTCFEHKVIFHVSPVLQDYVSASMMTFAGLKVSVVAEHDAPGTSRRKAITFDDAGDKENEKNGLDRQLKKDFGAQQVSKKSELDKIQVSS